MQSGRISPAPLLKLAHVLLRKLRPLKKMVMQQCSLPMTIRRKRAPHRVCSDTSKKAGTTPKRKVVEFPVFEGKESKELAVGDQVTVDLFEENDWVDVVGTSKGKGFQGVVRRHGFSGVGGQTHGQHNRLRAPGSAGASSYPSRVLPGRKLGGRMGGDRVKVLNLVIVKLIPESNLMLVKGSVPGAIGSYLLIEE